MKKQKSTIKLSKETKKRLAELGSKGDTYEGIILRLLSNYKVVRNIYK